MFKLDTAFPTCPHCGKTKTYTKRGGFNPTEILICDECEETYVAKFKLDKYLDMITTETYKNISDLSNPHSVPDYWRVL